MTVFHRSVLLKESVNALHVIQDGIYVDVTFGGGGHSRLILDKIQNGKVVAFDQDKEALKNTINNDERFIMINKNFRLLKDELALLGVFSIDGLIADLGVSAYHFTNNNRGFSLKYDSVLDMRMDTSSKKDGLFVVNKYDQKNLARIFKQYADFNNPNFIVNAIISARSKKNIKTTFDLKSALRDYVPYKNQNQFFARIFQAIRIEVNDEICALKELLKQALDILNPKGRLVVISYHSKEDKLVKSFMKFGNFLNTPNQDFFGNITKPFKQITKKPIVPSLDEVNSNNKARSAKMRVCEKI